MIALGEHWQFILAAYGAAGFGIAALIGAAWRERRSVQRRLSALEQTGARRRSRQEP